MKALNILLSILFIPTIGSTQINSFTDPYIKQINTSFEYVNEEPGSNSIFGDSDELQANSFFDKPGTNKSSNIPILDSIYNWQWDGQTFTWSNSPYSRTIDIFYDANYNETSRTIQLWTGSDWQNDEQFINTYDFNNNKTSYLRKRWIGNAWVNIIRIEYLYDMNNNQTSRTGQEWDDIQSIWQYNERGILTYNSNSNQTSSTFQYWTGTWTNMYFDTITYNSNYYLLTWKHHFWDGNDWENANLNTATYDQNDVVSTFLYQSWDGNVWQNNSQTIPIYDLNGNNLNWIRQLWNGAVWVNYRQGTFTYDPDNNRSTSLFQNWDSTLWENSTRYAYSYNLNNDETISFGETWDGTSWINYEDQTHSFDANNFIASRTTKYWDSGNFVALGDSSHYYFHIVTGITDEQIDVLDLIIYPNPFTSSLTIEFGVAEQIDKISILDIFGRDIYTVDVKGKERIIWECGELANGIYVVRASDKNKVHSFKCIKR